jgi:hypothetical protein
MFSFYNYGIALAMVSHVIVSTYFVIYETSLLFVALVEILVL